MALQAIEKRKDPTAHAQEARETWLARTQRKLLLDSIGPELAEKIDRIREWSRADNASTLLRHYDLGLIVKEVYDDDPDQDGPGRYGRYAMKKLASALAWCSTVLYEALAFAQTYTREEVDGLSRLRLPSGASVSWSHVRILVFVADRAERERLLRRVVEESWGCAELAREVAKGKAKTAGTRGRPLARPRDLDGVLRQQGLLADRLLERDEKVWSDQACSLTGRFLELPPDGHSAERGLALKENVERWRRVVRAAQDRLREAEEVYGRFLRARAGRAPTGPELKEAEREGPAAGEVSGVAASLTAWAAEAPDDAGGAPASTGTTACGARRSGAGVVPRRGRETR
jgi:hypothetical protein